MRLRSLALGLILPLAAACNCGANPGNGDGGAGGGTGGPIEVTIAAPADNAAFDENAPITFEGVGIDTRDGTSLTGTSLVWTSDSAGQLGTGEMLTTTLALGAHQITLTATAGDGTTGSASILVSVVQPALTVRIQNPNDRDIFATGDTINFDCRARLNGNPIPNVNIVWTSDASGQFGLGASVQTALTDGTHNITCTATDPATGDTGSDTIRITIGEPAIRIDTPNDGATENWGTTLDFQSTVITSDAAPYDVVWSSDIDGQIGLGQDIQTALASEGTHKITASFTDLAGKTATDTITLVYLKPNTPPDVVITTPAADGSRVAAGDTIDLAGTATDAEDGDLTASATWRDPVAGNLGTGGSATITNAVAGKYSVTLEATDSRGATGRDTRVIYVDPAAGPLVADNTNITNVRDATATGTGVWYAHDTGFMFDDGTTQTMVTLANASQAGGANRGQAVATNGTVTAFGSDDGLATCTGAADALTCTSYTNALDGALGTTDVNDIVVLSDGTTVAATDQGIFVIDPAGNTSDFDGGDWNGDDQVRALYDDGTLVWLATDNGLVSYDPSNDTFDRYDNNGLRDSGLRDVVALADDDVWVAHDEGISHMTGTPNDPQWENFGQDEGLQGGRVFAIAIDSRGIIWGGTDGGGAFRFDPSIGTFLMITTDDGLPSNVVRSVAIDVDDVKHFGTDAGVAYWYGR